MYVARRMWIVLRLILAVVAFVVRARRHPLRKSGAPTQKGERAELLVKTHGGKKINALTLGMRCPSLAWVQLSREGWTDRLVKALGLASELQTGDASFDDKIYVACDHPRAKELIAGSKELRAAILRAFKLGCRRVRYDGRAVWLEHITGRKVSEQHEEILRRLVAASGALAGEPMRWYQDRFLWRALAVESVLWSIAGYAVGALLGLAATAEWHWEIGPLLPIGLSVAAALLVAMILLIGALMRGSSRGHRVLLESKLLLLLALPIASVQLAADSNRLLDTSLPVLAVAAVRDCEVHRYKGRDTYYLQLDPSVPAKLSVAAELELPDEIKAKEGVCLEAERLGTIELVLGMGRWGVPWLRELRAGSVSWTLSR